MSDQPTIRKVLPIALLGIAFVAIGACVAFWGVWVSHGRIASHPPTTVVIGVGARWAAIGLACFGIAMLGVLWRRVGVVVVWMTLWFALGIAANFVQPLACARVDLATVLCQ